MSCVLTLLVIGGTCWADALIDVDFGYGPGLKPIQTKAPERVTGVLPEGVKEDSGWADVKVDYIYIPNRLGGDRGDLRIQLSDHRSGQGQLKVALPPLDEEAIYRLSTTLSSPDARSITVGIREQVDPYRSFWEYDIPVNSQRQQAVVEFELPPIDASVAFFVYLGTSGTFDFRSLTLERVTREELREQEARLAAAAPPNLLPWSGFSLGLPTGWSIGRSRMSATLDFQMTVADGPTERGTVPLRLQTKGKEALDLVTAPFFIPAASVPHTFSYYVKGKPESGAILEIIADGEVLQHRPIFGSSDGSWSRESVTFEPRVGGRWHVARWNFKGGIELDSLMLHPGTEADPFETMGAVELALTADWEKNHVFMEGVEEPTLTFWSGGDREGAILKSRVVNIHGQWKALPDQDLEKTATGSLDPGIPFADHPYGPHRVEAWAERDGQRISPVVERVYFRVRQPRFWGVEAPQSHFGVHHGDYEPHLYSSKAIGANWNRFHGPSGDETTYWSAVEPQPGEWRWHDDRMDLYQKYHHSLIGVLTKCPGWARVERKEHWPGGWLDLWWQPEDYDQFAAYAKKVAEKYKGVIDAWQIWNEPWGEFWFKEWRPELGSPAQWNPGETPAEDFAEMCAKAYEAIRTVDRETPVIGINATIGDRGKDWMERMVKLGVDGMQSDTSFHAYVGGDAGSTLSRDDVFYTNLKYRVLEPWRKSPKSDDQDIWVTETQQFWRQADSGMFYHALDGEVSSLDTIRRHADRQGPFQLVLMSEGVDKIILYSMIGFYFKPMGAGQLDWSCLTMKNGELDPSAAAYSAFTWHLDGRNFVERKTIQPGIEWFHFRPGEVSPDNSPDNRTVVVVAPGDGHSAPVVPTVEGVVLRDFLGNPLPEGSPLGYTLVYATMAEERVADFESALADARPGLAETVTAYPVAMEMPPVPAFTQAGSEAIENTEDATAPADPTSAEPEAAPGEGAGKPEQSLFERLMKILE